MSVKYHGDEYSAKNGKLSLLYMNIKDIRDIKGIENLTNLRYLDLSENHITEIKGLENLTNLRFLDFSRNKITEIKGLENLTNLESFWIRRNPVEEWVHKKFTRFYWREPQKLVKYCRKKVEEDKIKAEKEREEIEKQEQKIREKEREEKIDKEAIEKIKKMIKVSDRIKIDMMRQIMKMDKDSFNDKILDWAADFDFRIDGDFLVIKQENVTAFIDALDHQFEIWGEKEAGKIEKI